MINFLLGLEVINWGGWDSTGDVAVDGHDLAR